jgi:hypothetical protein
MVVGVPICTFDTIATPRITIGPLVLRLHSVSSASFSEGQPTVVLSTRVMDWRDTFHSMTVDFGPSSEGYTAEHLRRHGTLQKRIPKRSDSATKSTSSGATSQSFPVAPTDLPSSENTSKDLSFSELKTQIFPPTFPGASLVAWVHFFPV